MASSNPASARTGAGHAGTATLRAHPIATQGAGCTIRSIRRGDIPDLKQLFLKLHLFNASLDPRFALAVEWERHFEVAMANALAGGRHLALLARDTASGRPAGFIHAAIHHDSPMWRYRTWVEVEALYVERAWRGSGLAEALLDPVGDWARSVGAPVLQLYVTSSNKRAIRFYEGHGFRPSQTIMRAMLPAS